MQDQAMANDDVRQVLRDFILTNFLPGEAPDTLADSTLLVTSGIIASLSLIELATFIEDRFSVSLRPDDLGTDRMDSIDLIVDLIAERTGAAGRPAGA
jgi:acyl carrier protein